MQLSQAQIDDEVRFWVLNQDREHALFYKLGIVDPALQAEAAALYDQYEDARQRDDLGAAMQILAKSQDFKSRALTASRERWIGWLFPLFYDHTRAELEIMLIRIQPGGIAPRGEICAVDRFNADHVAFAAHLADPMEGAVLAKAAPLAVNTADLANRCATETYASLLELSRRAASDVDGFFSGFDPSKTQSVIHPALAAHVVREGKRFVTNLATLPMTDPATPAAPMASWR